MILNIGERRLDMKKLVIGGVLIVVCILAGLLAGATWEQVTIFLLVCLALFLACYRRDLE